MKKRLELGASQRESTNAAHELEKSMLESADIHKRVIETGEGDDAEEQSFVKLVDIKKAWEKTKKKGKMVKVIEEVHEDLNDPSRFRRTPWKPSNKKISDLVQRKIASYLSGSLVRDDLNLVLISIPVLMHNHIKFVFFIVSWSALLLL